MKFSTLHLLLFLMVSQLTFPQSISQMKMELKGTDFQKEEIQQSHGVQFNFEKKSPALAILYSALLPGMGELYAGNYSLGQYLTITEAVLWGTYIGIEKYGDWKKESYQSYAKSAGGVDLTNKNEEYFAKIADYRDIVQYNEEMSAQRNFKAMYNSESHYWNWATTSERRTYRSMWVSSQVSYNNLRFVVGGMILNRIASIINAVRLVTAYNKSQQANNSWNMNVNYSLDEYSPSNLSVNFQLQF
jgi:hypothetical protein